MTTFKAIFGRRWIIATVLVVLGMIVLARLGVWQWDRMLQKRAFNTMMAERWSKEPFDLNHNAFQATLRNWNTGVSRRKATFDYGDQILISNQVFNEHCRLCRGDAVCDG